MTGRRSSASGEPVDDVLNVMDVREGGVNNTSKKIELVPELLIDEVYLSEGMCDQLELPYTAEESDWNSVWSLNPGTVFDIS